MPYPYRILDLGDPGLTLKYFAGNSFIPGNIPQMS